MFKLDKLGGLLYNYVNSFLGENLNINDIENIRIKNILSEKKKIEKELDKVLNKNLKEIEKEYNENLKKIKERNEKDNDIVNRFSVWLKKQSLEIEKREKIVKLNELKKQIKKITKVPLEAIEIDKRIKESFSNEK